MSKVAILAMLVLAGCTQKHLYNKACTEPVRLIVGPYVLQLPAWAGSLPAPASLTAPPYQIVRKGQYGSYNDSLFFVSYDWPEKPDIDKNPDSGLVYRIHVDWMVKTAKARLEADNHFKFHRIVVKANKYIGQYKNFSYYQHRLNDCAVVCLVGRTVHFIYGISDKGVEKIMIYGELNPRPD